MYTLVSKSGLTWLAVYSLWLDCTLVRELDWKGKESYAYIHHPRFKLAADDCSSLAQRGFELVPPLPLLDNCVPNNENTRKYRDIYIGSYYFRFVVIILKTPLNVGETPRMLRRSE